MITPNLWLAFLVIASMHIKIKILIYLVLSHVCLTDVQVAE